MKDPLKVINSSITPDSYGPPDPIRRAFEVLFTDGTYPHWHSQEKRPVLRTSPLAPEGAELLRSFSGQPQRSYKEDIDNREELYGGEGWLLHASWHRHDSNVRLDAIAATPELARNVVNLAVERLELREILPMKSPMVFRYQHSSGSAVRHREIELMSWNDIQGNYAAAVKPKLEELISMTPEKLHGQLISLHGPVGTGKTTFLRSLVHAWQDWCDPEYVMDPDKMFSQASYLISATIAAGHGAYGVEEEEESDESEKWRLMILEDTGELLTGSAKQEMGQQLSRLLNITDGLPGQGLKLLVAITSNEDLSRFHPAIVRPGRCLQQVEIPQLPYPEAKAWLNGQGELLETRSYALAELYSIRDGRDVRSEPEQVGQFL